MDESEVVTPPAGETVGSGNDDRLARLSAIADQSENDRADDLANVNDDNTTEPFRTAAPESTDDSPTGEPDTVVEPEATAAPQKFKIKVNGRELELTQDELIARASKVEAADDYLRRAKEQTRTEQPAQPTKEELQRRQDEEDQALVRAIQMGTTEEATAALRKLREQASARPSISVDDVSRTVDERLAFTSAVSKFRDEFKDLVSDPYLEKIVLDRDQELLSQGDSRPYYERYVDIGTSVRKWRDGLLASVQPAARDNITTKEAAKAAAPKVPSAANAKTKPPVQEDDSDENPADVIAAMAKSRGGPQWMRS